MTHDAWKMGLGKRGRKKFTRKIAALAIMAIKM